MGREENHIFPKPDMLDDKFFYAFPSEQSNQATDTGSFKSFNHVQFPSTRRLPAAQYYPQARKLKLAA